MTIIDGATFHDGEPLTAEDVAFSIQLYKDTEDFPFLPSYAAPFETIEATDATTVTLTTAEPLGNFEANMAFIYVLPKHIWEGEADPVAFENAEMIGSGAFKLVEAVQNESVELAANTDYWGTPPNVDGVIFQKFDNADARITALTTGDIDAITEFPATAVSALQNAENVEVHIADVGGGRQPARHHPQRRRRRRLPGRGRRLLRPSGAQGPRRAAGPGARHRQAADHRRGHPRHGGARPLDGSAGPR